MQSMYLWEGGRQPVASLRPYLRAAFLSQAGNAMDAALMDPDAARSCRWLGFSMGKGITSPELDCSVFGVPERCQAGLHGELIRGLPGTDLPPLCYAAEHILGFGNFVRWVFFADPHGQQDFCGIDFSVMLRPTAGVATTFAKVWRTVSTLVAHGLPPSTDVVLLNARMCEYPYMSAVREAAGLVQAHDWMRKGPSLFGRRSNFCPACGQQTFDDLSAQFCSQCGFAQEIVPLEKV